jgi:peptide/nickel transport system permease protein
MTWTYVATRLGTFCLVVFVAITINFLVPRLAPGDPVTQRLEATGSQGTTVGGDFRELVEAYKKKFGYDQPLWKQYLNYWGDLFRGDLGYSIAKYPARTSEIIAHALPWSVALLGTATLIGFGIGTIGGALLAWPATPKVLSRLFIPVFVVLSSVPYYLLGLILLFLFSLTLPWFPSGGGHGTFMELDWDFESLVDVLHHAVLPGLSIVLASIAFWALGMRGMMIGIQGEDFMTLAQAKGLKKTRIFFNYAMRNAFLPQATHLALSLGHVVSGAVLVEVIFRYPGIGYSLFEAIVGKDYFVIQGILLLLILSIAFAMLVMDFVYPLLDPRVSYGRKA